MTETEKPRKPLDGIKVVELSTYIAAPVCARMLGDLGAEVVKLENFCGDPWRGTAMALTRSSLEENPVFEIYNAGKKSLAVDIKHKDGLEVVHRLLEDADIFITNTRPQSLRKLGLAYENLRELYPGLIYATVTGFGPKGPKADHPGFDNIAYWTDSGFLTDMMVETPGSFPVSPPTGGGDTVVGNVLLSGILAALYRRERTGTGDFVTASLYNAGIWSLSSMVIQAQQKYGNRFPKKAEETVPFSAAYRCADGKWLCLTVLDYERYARPLYRALGIEQEAEALGIRSYTDMLNGQAELLPLFRGAFMQKTAARWEEILHAEDIVCGVMPHFRDVTESEQAWVNDYVETYAFRTGDTCVMPVPPIRLASQEVPRSAPAPLTGEDTERILNALGYQAEQIAKMRADGAVK